MAKIQCIICSFGKGERVCKINDNALICSVCCAKTRSEICEGCRHYVQAQRYAREKSQPRSDKKEFICEINPVVEEEVDRALAMVERGKIDQGEKIIVELLEEYPQLYIVQYGMGVVYAMKGQHDRALPYFDKAVEIYPYFVEGWFNKGAAHQKRLEVRELIMAFQKVVELGDPSEHFVRQAKSFIKDMEKNIKEENGLSLDAFLKIADIYNKAYTAMEEMKWEEALAGFRMVLASNPKHVQSYGNMGLCLAFLERKQEALEAFGNALALDPNYAPAKSNRQIVLSLKDGEKLSDKLFASVDYYKDLVLKERSLSRKVPEKSHFPSSRVVHGTSCHPFEQNTNPSLRA